jgi:hypothetical protein
VGLGGAVRTRRLFLCINPYHSRRRSRTEQLYSDQPCAGRWWRWGWFALDAAYWAAFRLSGGVLAGRSTGWVGLFGKTDPD